MISKKIKAVSFVATIGLFSGVAYADQESQIQRLGDDLTPLGAEKSGNEDGRIPEWTGGLPVDAAPVLAAVVRAAVGPPRLGPARPRRRHVWRYHELVGWWRGW